MAKRRKRYKKLRDGLLWLLLLLLSRLPLRINHAIGATLGWLSWILPTRGSRITRINLALCFPEKEASWHRRVGRRSLMEMGKSATEAPWLWRQAQIRSFPELADYPPDAKPSRPRQPGQALFLVTPHLGSWEFFGLQSASFGKITSLYSPLPVPKIDLWVREARSSTGATLAPANRQGLRLLKQARDHGETIGLLPDQVPRNASGVHAPFFGHPALTMTLLQRLLRDRDDLVVFAFAERLPGSQGFRYHTITAGPEVADADPVRAAAAMNRIVEELIRRCPEQYNWAYKRFSPAAPGQPDYYQKPGK